MIPSTKKYLLDAWYALCSIPSDGRWDCIYLKNMLCFYYNFSLLFGIRFRSHFPFAQNITLQYRLTPLIQKGTASTHPTPFRATCDCSTKRTNCQPVAVAGITIDSKITVHCCACIWYCATDATRETTEWHAK